MDTILIVDDDKVSLSAAKGVLGVSYKTILVKHGEQALRYLESNPCDLVLLDINMPEMNGFEVYDRIRCIPGCRELPVIFLTADNDAAVETQCFETGAIDFIAKPFVPSVIRSRVARVLELEKLRISLADRLKQKTEEVSEIRLRAQTDALTGLWNRKYTEQHANQYLEQGVPGAVMMIDMDNFKSINDIYGHQEGDRVLMMFADTLRENSEKEDILCRIGGDEFLVFVSGNTERQILAQRAQAIIDQIAQKLKAADYQTNTSVSVGIAEAPGDGTSFSKLYHCADKALYFVKQNGKKSFRFFREQYGNTNSDRLGTAGLQELHSQILRSDSGANTYMTDFGIFEHLYHMSARDVTRSQRCIFSVLFTLDAPSEENMELLQQLISEAEMHQAAAAPYSDGQLIFFVPDATEADTKAFAETICRAFGQKAASGTAAFEMMQMPERPVYKKETK
ncbi:MAG: diguanylate cyclase [Oscillospiraceae bacterium]|nr:diguanylate cyclase [Oscillospiraceae bacterium]